MTYKGWGILIGLIVGMASALATNLALGYTTYNAIQKIKTNNVLVPRDPGKCFEVQFGTPEKGIPDKVTEKHC